MRLVLISAIALSAGLVSCAQHAPPHPPPSDLLSGAHASVPTAARASARRFATAYARSIYDPSPPRLPAATPEVALALRAAASRIPPSRRGLTPRPSGLALRPLDAEHASAAVTIDDGRSPPFSVGFTLDLRDGRWLVTRISPPG